MDRNNHECGRPAGHQHATEEPLRLPLNPQRQHTSNQEPVKLPALRTRVKTGCLTCKGRKVKCDETLPTCIRCQRGGRICEGYPEIYNGRFPRNSPTYFRTTDLVYRSPHEYQGFSFYLELSQLAGPFDSSFWANYVPQIGKASPAVHHAIVALGAFQHSVQNGSSTCAPTSPVYDFKTSIEHYNKAIRILQTGTAYDNEESLQAVLVSSLLFTQLECLMGNYETGALMHLRSGLDILSAQRCKYPRIRQNSSDTGDIQAQIDRLFADLELQAAFAISGRREENLGPRRQAQLFHTSASGPPRLTNISEAKHSLHSVLSPILDIFLEHLRISVDGDREKHRGDIQKSKSRLEEWSTQFRRYLVDSQSRLSSEELKGAVQLKIEQKFANIMLETSIRPPEEISQLFDEYESMLKLVKSLLEMDPGRGKRKVGLAGMWVGMFVYFTTVYCANLSLRRQAAEMLAFFGLKEGFWDGVILSKMAHHVLVLDEAEMSRTGSEVVHKLPRQVFIEDMSASERRGILKISTGVDGSAELINELIEW